LSAGLFGASSLLVGACGASPTAASSQGSITVFSVADLDRKHTADFVRIEDSAIDWLVAADPRLAARVGTPASLAILGRIGTDAVLAEDSSLQIRAGSVDLFSFRARKQALREAASTLAGFHDDLPAVGPPGSGLGRPQLERELITRIIDEELVRAGTEERLGDASGDLVRAMVATWTPPSAPPEWLDRDQWVSSHLLEIRQSLLSVGPRTGPIDLDLALYPLERLLEPRQFPRSAAAIAQVRIALDSDMRAMPRRSPSDLLARAVWDHLGVVVDPAALPSRFERLAGRLREMADAAVGAIDPTIQRRSVEARARALLLVEHSCPAVPDSRVRSMAPPPERAAICGLVQSLSAEPSRAAALTALHDDVLLSLGALVTDPPPRTRLLSHPDNDAVEELERAARERPVAALGVALAAELLYGGDHPDDRVQAWRSLGDAPLDVVARELDAQPSAR
jgi:hypothetical protein